MEWIIGILIFFGISYAFKAHEKKTRRKNLLSKYGRDHKVVDMIMKRMFWQGQTEEQLCDSLGKPSGIDQKVLKTKTKEIWKYHPRGGNRFDLRITLEDGIVVGWDKKD